MILVSKVLWGSATVAMLAAPAVVPGAADVARGLSRAAGAFASAADASTLGPVTPRCAASCDAWAVLARTR